jgi:hypothetical protein
VLAQWSDNFADGDISANPTWQGQTDQFSVADGQLKLQAPAVSGVTYTTTASGALSNSSWRFLVSMDFNPSASNYARVFLASDLPDLSAPLTGYFVMIGGSSDDVSLYLQEGSSRTKIIDGPDGMLNLASFSIRINVTHDEAAGWTLYTDVGDTGEFTPVGKSNHVPGPTTNYFGVQCIYTSTRSTGFSFDDFEVLSNVVDDTFPPRVTQIAVVDSLRIDVVFSEAVDETTAKELSNYVISPDDQTPEYVVHGEDKKIVSLILRSPLVNGVTHILSISGIKDLSGNLIQNHTNSVMYFRARRHNPDDIVITEIFPDPSPSEQLPESEFAELLNRSSNPIQLKGWKITDGSTVATLPDMIFPAASYLILTRSSAEQAYDQEGATVGLEDFPSLNNGSDILQLIDAGGITIDSIRYSDDWYRDEKKREGGWTLEIIDPDNLCGESENWSASMAEMGGTPGKPNSVHAENPDLTPPSIHQVVPIGQDTLRFYWSEKLEKVVPSTSSFSISPFLEIREVRFHGAALREVDLILAASLATATAYSLQITGVRDCAGNEREDSDVVTVALPEVALRGDVVINEILFNPTSTGVDFVELLNVSKKFIDVSHLSLAIPRDSSYVDAKPLSMQQRLIGPGEFLVATTRPDVLESEYIRSVGRPMTVCDLPSLPDDSGAIAIVGPFGEQLDAMHYDADMHSPFVEDEEGVSLERISAYQPTLNPENWTSAAKSRGYATPGETNSNFRPDGAASGGVTVAPECFDPAHGGFTQIRYTLQKSGMIGNVDILDSQGRRLKTLAHGELLGTSGFIRWDGDSDQGLPVRTGAYMVLFEVFDSRGVVSTTRKRVVIAGKF